MSSPDPAPRPSAAPVLAPDPAPTPDLSATPAPANPLSRLDPPPPPADLDSHGHDLAAYDWVPVLRKPRADGWSPARQRAFIEALADTGSVAQAARETGMSVQSCYRLRRSPQARGFAAAWDAAIAEAGKRLVDIAFDRAVNGVEVPIIDAHGNRTGVRVQHSDRLLMFLIRAHHPDRYRHARHDTRPAGEAATPPLALPVATALAALTPETPPDPHLLTPPDRLADALLVADLIGGALPPWRRDPPADPAPPAPPLGEAFEGALDAAKALGRSPSPPPAPTPVDTPVVGAGEGDIAASQA